MQDDARSTSRARHKLFSPVLAPPEAAIDLRSQVFQNDIRAVHSQSQHSSSSDGGSTLLATS